VRHHMDRVLRSSREVRNGQLSHHGSRIGMLEEDILAAYPGGWEVIRFRCRRRWRSKLQRSALFCRGRPGTKLRMEDWQLVDELAQTPKTSSSTPLSLDCDRLVHSFSTSPSTSTERSNCVRESRIGFFTGRLSSVSRLDADLQLSEGTCAAEVTRQASNSKAGLSITMLTVYAGSWLVRKIQGRRIDGRVRRDNGS
jgi:hypothetical protein